MKLYLNNILIPKDDYTTSEFVITKTNTESRDVTREFEFDGIARDIIFSEIIDNPLGLIAKVPVKIIDGCCGNNILFFEGEIRGDAVQFCEGDCSLNATAYQVSSENRVIECFKSYAIEQIDKINNQKNQLVGYCNEARPQFVHDLLIILGSLGILLFFFIDVIIISFIGLAELIRTILATLLLDRIFNVNFDLDKLRFTKRLKDQIRDFIVPCKYQPTAYVRDIMQGACEKCGANFISSIFNNVGSEYYNTLYFAAQSKEGFENENSYNIGLIAGNLPVKSIYDFFVDFREINIDFKVKKINNVDTVFVERKDFFDTTDTISLPSDAKICYSSISEAPEAFAIVEYRQDAMDLVGSESKNEWYKKLFEWNLPVSPIQKESKQYQINFGMHRQIDDNIKRTVYEAYRGLFSTIFGLNLKKYKEWLLLHNGIAFVTKLLVWNPNRQLIKDFNKSWHAQNLYNNFLFIDNPRLTGYKRWDVDITFDKTCDNYQTWLNAVDKNIQTTRGVVKDLEITINASTQKIRVKGKL